MTRPAWVIAIGIVVLAAFGSYALSLGYDGYLTVVVIGALCLAIGVPIGWLFPSTGGQRPLGRNVETENDSQVN